MHAVHAVTSTTAPRACENGDEEVDPEICPAIDSECYEVTLCGTTITCAG